MITCAYSDARDCSECLEPVCRGTEQPAPEQEAG